MVSTHFLDFKTKIRTTQAQVCTKGQISQFKQALKQKVPTREGGTQYLTVHKVNTMINSSFISGGLSLDFIMSFQVCLQVIEAGVGLSTLVANVWSYPCVLHAVLFQPASTGKSFPTLGAYIWTFPCVDALMNGHLARLNKPFPTNRALVGLFPRVRASVYLQLTG